MIFIAIIAFFCLYILAMIYAGSMGILVGLTAVAYGFIAFLKFCFIAIIVASLIAMIIGFTKGHSNYNKLNDDNNDNGVDLKAIKSNADSRISKNKMVDNDLDMLIMDDYIMVDCNNETVSIGLDNMQRILFSNKSFEYNLWNEEYTKVTKGDFRISESQKKELIERIKEFHSEVKVNVLAGDVEIIISRNGYEPLKSSIMPSNTDIAISIFAVLCIIAFFIPEQDTNYESNLEHESIISNEETVIEKEKEEDISEKLNHTEVYYANKGLGSVYETEKILKDNEYEYKYSVPVNDNQWVRKYYSNSRGEELAIVIAGTGIFDKYVADVSKH